MRPFSGGELKPGDKIPPVRKLAEELVVYPNTVAKAYRQMEQMGLVQTREGGAGHEGNDAVDDPFGHTVRFLVIGVV